MGVPLVECDTFEWGGGPRNTYGENLYLDSLSSHLTLLGLQSPVLGTKQPNKFQVVCPQNGTAVLF